MSNKRIYPSVATLPVEDIAEYLRIVHGFRSRNELAPDVKKVSEVDSAKIAIAAMNKDGSLVLDRNTVENSLKLGGLNASEYLTIANSNMLLADTHKVSTITGDEIQNLRDELYQMKNELVKNGLIRDSYSYNGFQDPFREGSIKYIDEVVTRGAQVEARATISDITVIDSSEIEIGEFIVIEDGNKKYITKVTNKEGNRLFINPSITGPFDTTAVIKKALGMYYNGTFLFGERLGQIITPKEKYVMLNDDTNTFALPRITRPDNGYVVMFKVPENAKGAIKRFSLNLRAFGAPGNLKCYIADPSDSDGKDIFKMPTIDAMKEAGKIIGESDSVSNDLASSAFNELDFNFNNPAIVDGKVYVAIIKCLDADESNYWEVMGVRKSGGGDLQTNMKLFHYKESVEANAISTEVADSDLYFTLVTNEVVKNNIGYKQQGLYSTKIELPDNTSATRVRVELKANREGRFKVIDNPSALVIKEGESINLINEDNKQYSGSIFTSGSTVVVGNQISTVGNSRLSNIHFSLAKDTYAPANAPVYRVGYKVIVKARKKTIDYSNPSNPIKYSGTIVKELPLTAVIPGRESGKEKNSTDRLIFESDIALLGNSDYILDDYNDFTVQVFWANTGVTEQEMYGNPELAGSMFDIAVAVDRTFNKKENVLATKIKEEA